MHKRHPDHVQRGAVLNWAIFTGLTVFAAVLLWHFGLIATMASADRTHISMLIIALYGAASLHCLYRTIVISRESEAAWRAAEDGGDLLPFAEGTELGPPGNSLIKSYMRDLAAQSGRNGGGPVDQTPLLRALASQLRGSNQIGGLASDLLMKLGLTGTIVGFIIMLAPVATLDTGNQSAIKASMNLMSAGMAVAMYTTLTGLVSSILIKIQYFMLETQTSKLFTFAVKLTGLQAGSPAASRGGRSK